MTVCPGTSPQGHPANGSSCSCWGGVGWQGKVGTPKIRMQSTYLQRLGHLGLSYQLGKQPTHKFKAQAPCSHLVRSFCASPWWHCSVLTSCLSQGSDESVRPGAPTPPQNNVTQGLWHMQTAHKSSKANFELYWFYILPSGQACVSKNKFLTSTRWRFLKAALEKDSHSMCVT